MIACLITSLFNPEIVKPRYILFLIAIPISQYAVYYAMQARIQEKFYIYSFSNVLGAMLSLAGSVLVGLFVSGDKVVPMTAVWFLNQVGVIVLCHFLLKIKHKTSKLDLNILKKLVLVGFPPSLLPFGTLLLQSVDRWVVAEVCTRENLGYYSLGSTMAITLSVLPQSFISTLTKKLSRFAKEKNLFSLKYTLDISMEILSFIQACICSSLIFVMPLILKFAFPKYQVGVDTISFMVASSSFLFPLSVSYELCVSMRRMKELFMIVLIFVALESGIVLVGSTLQSISGAALGLCICNAFLGLTLGTWSYSLCGMNLWESAKKMGVYYARVIFVVISGFYWKINGIADISLENLAPFFGFMSLLVIFVYYTFQSVSNLSKSTSHLRGEDGIHT